MPTRSCSDDPMPRPRPPHVHRQTTRHGATVWYVRVGHGPRIRLKSAPGQPGFEAEYRAALEGGRKADTKRVEAGSISWLIARYRETAVWTALSLATRRQRETIFRQIVETSGTASAARLTMEAVVKGLDRRRETPAQARHYLDTLRGLCQWAFQAGHIKADPTVGVHPPKAPRGKADEDDGFPAWTAEDVARFEAKWPIGTRARVAFDVLRYTGLRRGDAARLGRPHVKDGVIAIRTEKTGEWVTIRMAPPLAATIAAGPTGDLTYIAGERGRPLTKESFGNQFRDWCREAGIDKSAHGIRKLAATTAAENGATVSELEAMFGWSGGGMASLYTRAANRKRLGLGASDKLVGTDPENPIPSPHGQVRESH